MVCLETIMYNVGSFYWRCTAMPFLTIPPSTVQVRPSGGKRKPALRSKPAGSRNRRQKPVGFVLALGFLGANSIGPPVPFHRFFLGGRLLKETAEKKSGTLILSSLLEDLASELRQAKRMASDPFGWFSLWVSPENMARLN